MAFISLQLGIFNLLPIPALDGGHIFMLLLEKLKGAPLSVSTREKTQMIGFSVLISLMIFVTWNDIMSLFSNYISNNSGLVLRGYIGLPKRS